MRQCGQRVIKKVLTVATSLLACSNVNGAQTSFEQEQKALTIIADFADRICKDIPLKGKQSKVELSGNAKAELRGIVKKFADLGVEGVAKYQDAQYEGLLQSDLLNAIQSSDKCRLNVFDSLKDRLLPPKRSTAPFKPNPPTQLTVNCLKGQGFLLRWYDNSVNELGFNIYRWWGDEKQKERNYKLIRTVEADATQYLDADSFLGMECLPPGVAISYQVASYNETGESDRIQFVLLPALPPLSTGAAATPTNRKVARAESHERFLR